MQVVYRSCQSSPCFQPTYEGLKQLFGLGRKGVVTMFSAYLRGIETSFRISLRLRLSSFQPTYEGLKLLYLPPLFLKSKGFQPTYEGLKPYKSNKCVVFVSVFSLPTRD